MGSRHCTVYNATFNAYRAIRKDWGIHIGCVFPLNICLFEFILISSGSGTKISIFFLIALLRKIDLIIVFDNKKVTSLC